MKQSGIFAPPGAELQYSPAKESGNRPVQNSIFTAISLTPMHACLKAINSLTNEHREQETVTFCHYCVMALQKQLRV